LGRNWTYAPYFQQQQVPTPTPSLCAPSTSPSPQPNPSLHVRFVNSTNLDFDCLTITHPENIDTITSLASGQATDYIPIDFAYDDCLLMTAHADGVEYIAYDLISCFHQTEKIQPGFYTYELTFDGRISASGKPQLSFTQRYGPVPDPVCENSPDRVFNNTLGDTYVRVHNIGDEAFDCVIVYFDGLIKNYGPLLAGNTSDYVRIPGHAMETCVTIFAYTKSVTYSHRVLDCQGESYLEDGAYSYRLTSTTDPGWLNPDERQLRLETRQHNLLSPPRGPGVELGKPYPYKLDTHCAIVSTYFNGNLWKANPILTNQNGNVPNDWIPADATGTMTLVTEDRAVFNADSGRVIEWIPWPKDEFQFPCF
jgi:hypothetical protein